MNKKACSRDGATGIIRAEHYEWKSPKCFTCPIASCCWGNNRILSFQVQLNCLFNPKQTSEIFKKIGQALTLFSSGSVLPIYTKNDMKANSIWIVRFVQVLIDGTSSRIPVFHWKLFERISLYQLLMIYYKVTIFLAWSLTNTFGLFGSLYDQELGPTPSLGETTASGLLDSNLGQPHRV